MRIACDEAVRDGTAAGSRESNRRRAAHRRVEAVANHHQMAAALPDSRRDRSPDEGPGRSPGDDSVTVTAHPEPRPPDFRRSASLSLIDPPTVARGKNARSRTCVRGWPRAGLLGGRTSGSVDLVDIGPRHRSLRARPAGAPAVRRWASRSPARGRAGTGPGGGSCPVTTDGVPTTVPDAPAAPRPPVRGGPGRPWVLSRVVD